MTRASLRHYRATHAMVVGGVAVAVAVLAGALLVGASVRASLRDLALSRLGNTEFVLATTTSFRDALAADLQLGSVPLDAAPVVALDAAVVHEDSGRMAARVQVFGIDRRFMAFHGLAGMAPAGRDAWLSERLAAELNAASGQRLALRVARPTDIPLGTVQGRREDAGERINLTMARVVDRAALGEFSLVPSQGPVLTVFVPLDLLRRELDLESRANTLLLRTRSPAAVADVRTALAARVTADDLALKTRRGRTPDIFVLESRSGLLPPPVVDAARRGAGDRPVVGSMTYLANTIRVGTREIPYSVVSAIDLDAYEQLAARSPRVDRRDARLRDGAPEGAPLRGEAAARSPIWLNAWAADDLRPRPGDTVTLEYYLWSDERGLTTSSADFTFAGVVPMDSAGGDRTLAPEYPGISDAADVTAWDPPFPVDLQRIRPKDEAYWDQWRTAPKAFIPLEAGERLWPSPFGTLSSLRARHELTVQGALDPFAAGLTFRDVRGEALAAAEGTTDFGEYFTYFSFFLVVAGVLLAGLFFALSVEQRTKELGLLGATGFPRLFIRRLMLTEAAVLVIIASIIGMAGAVAYAAVIMHGLRTWWQGASGTTALTLHVDAAQLVGGAAGGGIAAFGALALTLRRLLRYTPRTLLAGVLRESGPATDLSLRRTGRAAVFLAIVAATLTFTAAIGALNQSAAFFGAGAMVMLAGFFTLSWWLRRERGARRVNSVPALGADYARWRPTRSVLSAATIAFACFVLVSVGAFRRDPSGISIDRTSGTGGFTLMAESVAPLMHNPNTPAGRDELALPPDAALSAMRVARFRLRPGDESSCLTLYRPTNPRIIAPEAAFLAEGRFAFASASLATTAEERANPWLLLNRRFEDGAIPAIADQTSLTYVFHLNVGDEFTFSTAGLEHVRLRIVAALVDSVLQSELIIGEHDFVRLFPRHEGYRVWMIETPPAAADNVATVLEDQLADFGVDVTDTRARLAAYHEVENTYLATFQALGGLGLLFGTLGLAAVLARNVLERRREIGLLGAIGFTPAHVTRMVTAESLLLVGVGLALGTSAALVAVTPALTARGQSMPFVSILLLLAGVIAIGMLSSLAATRLATRMPVVEAIKSE